MKKIILSLLLLLPLCMVAQEIKIAVVNTDDVFTAMPEISVLENTLMVEREKWQAELQSMENDYNRKYSDLMSQQDSLNENIKSMRIQEIQELQTRMENLYQMSQQDMQKKQEELLAPIREKIQKAIEDVGEENGYTLIIAPQALLFSGKAVIDATDKVKAKIGIR